jgi:hypothetical protein
MYIMYIKLYFGVKRDTVRDARDFCTTFYFHSLFLV